MSGSQKRWCSRPFDVEKLVAQLPVIIVSECNVACELCQLALLEQYRQSAMFHLRLRHQYLNFGKADAKQLATVTENTGPTSSTSSDNACNLLRARIAMDRVIADLDMIRGLLDKIRASGLEGRATTVSDYANLVLFSQLFCMGAHSLLKASLIVGIPLTLLMLGMFLLLFGREVGHTVVLLAIMTCRRAVNQAAGQLQQEGSIVQVTDRLDSWGFKVLVLLIEIHGEEEETE